MYTMYITKNGFLQLQKCSQKGHINKKLPCSNEINNIKEKIDLFISKYLGDTINT